ncbi:MAG: isoprenyl transferase [Saprospiraceae bacterium]|mgnify:CR=1 FL=1|jgi:undecaprenyl diphosphate synthase
MNWKSRIDKTHLPEHVAVIMDGNGRWAKQQGKPRVFGHRNGVKAVRNTAEAAAELGIQWLTLYAFSKENWRRPKKEVGALMGLLVDTLGKEVKTLNENNIRLQAIGDLDLMPDRNRKALIRGMEDTRTNTGMTLILALNYSARWEIAEAAKKLTKQALLGEISPEDITEDRMAEALTTTGVPDPSLLIRTSGEKRISNFLLWQIAYAELYFIETLWPDFSKEDFYQAIVEYQSRERRFGKISEQLTT